MVSVGNVVIDTGGPTDLASEEQLASSSASASTGSF